MKPGQASTGEDRPQRQHAIHPIIDGPPPDAGRSQGSSARGIEVLLKKAAVDPQFRMLLLEQRSEAAESIQLELHPQEAVMINVVPQEQLAATIARTEVSQEHRRAFLGTAASAMLATLAAPYQTHGAQVTGGGFGGFAAGLGSPPVTRDRIAAFVSKQLDVKEDTVTPQSRIRDLANSDAERGALRQGLEDLFDLSLPSQKFDQIETIEDLRSHVLASLEVKPDVYQVIARRTGVTKAKLTRGTRLTDDLDVDRSQLASVRRDLARQMRVHVDWELFKRLETVGEIVNFTAELVVQRKEAERERREKKQ